MGLDGGFKHGCCPFTARIKNQLQILQGGHAAENLPDVVNGPSLPLHEARERFERDYIVRTLATQQGNISRTAEVLGVERSNLYRKMKAFGIVPTRREPREGPLAMEAPTGP